MILGFNLQGLHIFCTSNIHYIDNNNDNNNDKVNDKQRRQL